MAAITMPRSIAFSRATASAIWRSSSRLALTAIDSVSRCFRAAIKTAALIGIAGPRRLRGRSRAAFEGRGDQRIGQHQLGVRHLGDRQQDLGAVLEPDPRILPLPAQQLT